MGKDYSPVKELNRLKKLQKRLGFERYAEGFGLSRYGDAAGLEAGWSRDPEFLARLIPFAQANGTGSIYALWRVDDRDDLASLPVVVFGDEGGEYVVARDLRELLRLLAYDCEISVDHHRAYFYRGEDERHSDGHEQYVAWLERKFGLAPVTDVDAVVTAAQAEFQERFTSWLHPFLAAPRT
jgi:hypothetical protein